jgi:hypothetical protein
MNPTKTLITTAILSTLFLAILNVSAQEQSANGPGCKLLDKTLPSQFVSYESNSLQLTLRLHNNTSCSVVVETDDKVPTRLVQLPNGGRRFEAVSGSEDGVRLSLHYMIQDRQRRREPQPAYGWGDSVHHYEILAGRSVIFSVPIMLVRRRLDVVIPFNYSWENESAVRRTDGVVHRVYFLTQDAPRELRAISRRPPPTQ